MIEMIAGIVALINKLISLFQRTPAQKAADGQAAVKAAEDKADGSAHDVSDLDRLP